jgi:hypothetical protein
MGGRIYRKPERGFVHGYDPARQNGRVIAYRTTPTKRAQLVPPRPTMREVGAADRAYEEYVAWLCDPVNKEEVALSRNAVKPPVRQVRGWHFVHEADVEEHAPAEEGK